MIYAGIDLGGTTIKGALVSEKGEILHSKVIPTGAERAKELIVQDMGQLVLDMMSEYGCDPEEVVSVGVGSPGAIDPEAGKVIVANNFAAFADVPVREIMEEMLEKPIYVDNDANVAALGESMFGAGEGRKNCVMVTLGTGLGGGIIIGGKIFSGAYYGGAELGHQVLVVGGEACTCGRKGCWEAYSSATALIRMARLAANEYKDSKLWELCSGDASKINAKMVCDAFDLGDQAATEVMYTYYDYLAEGLANTCNVFQPEVLIVGGGISAQGEKLMAPVRERTVKMVFGGQGDKIIIRAATLGNNAGVIGAAMLGVVD